MKMRNLIELEETADNIGYAVKYDYDSWTLNFICRSCLKVFSYPINSLNTEHILGTLRKHRKECRGCVR